MEYLLYRERGCGQAYYDTEGGGEVGETEGAESNSAHEVRGAPAGESGEIIWSRRRGGFVYIVYSASA